MSWRHRIAVVVLLVLVALPLGGTICAMMCVSASSAVAAHHGDGQDCEPAAPASSNASHDASPDATAHAPEARIGTLTAFACGHHEGTLPQVAATAPPRADLAVMAAQAASDPVHPLFGSVTGVDSVFQYTSPPDTAPPTTTPLVLRV